MRSISQREVRNDNAEIMRAVETGESFLVTRNGTPVAVVKPAIAAELHALPLARAARRRIDFGSWSRIDVARSSEEILEELRGGR